MLTTAKWLSYTSLLFSFFLALAAMWGSGYEKDHSLWAPCLVFGIVGIGLLALKIKIEKKHAAEAVKIIPDLSILKRLAIGVLITIQLLCGASMFGSFSILYKIFIKGYPTIKEFDYVGFELTLLLGAASIFTVAHLVQRKIRRSSIRQKV